MTGPARSTLALAGAWLVAASVASLPPAAADSPVSTGSYVGEVLELEGLAPEGAITNVVLVDVEIQGDTVTARLTIDLKLDDTSTGDAFCRHLTVDATGITGTGAASGHATINTRLPVVDVFNASSCAEAELPNASTLNSTVELRFDQIDVQGTIQLGDDATSTLEFSAHHEVDGVDPEEPDGDVAGLGAFFEGSNVLDPDTARAVGTRAGCGQDRGPCEFARGRATAIRTLLGEAIRGQIDPAASRDLLDMETLASLRDPDGRLVAPSIRRMEPVLLRLYARALVLGDQAALRAANRLAGFLLIQDLE